MMLELRGLNQYYGGSHTLRGIDLSVPAGTCTALLGRNGVGKTTLLRCLMGLLPVRSGRIAFDGKEIGRLTVAENLAVGEAAAGPGRPITPRDELEALFPALRTMQRRRGGDLSGGQQQQLAIARALVARPKLLLLDEPTEGIQPSIVKDIERVLRVLLERGMTILLVEQYVDFAKSLAQHYAILSRGQVVDRGEVANLDTDEVRHHLAV